MCACSGPHACEAPLWPPVLRSRALPAHPSSHFTRAPAFLPLSPPQTLSRGLAPSAPTTGPATQRIPSSFQMMRRRSSTCRHRRPGLQQKRRQAGCPRLQRHRQRLDRRRQSRLQLARRQRASHKLRARRRQRRPQRPASSRRQKAQAQMRSLQLRSSRSSRSSRRPSAQSAPAVRPSLDSGEHRRQARGPGLESALPLDACWEELSRLCPARALHFDHPMPPACQ